MIDLTIVSGGILAVFTIIFLAKNLLIKYNFSKNGFKNFIFIFFGITALVISNAVMLYGSNVRQYKASIELSLKEDHKNVLHDGVPEEVILQQQLKSAEKMITGAEIAAAAGYVFLGIAFLTSKNIKNENNNFVPKGKWNLKKYK